ncbi:MAG: hypothetical protein KJ858_04715 [Nanoarchaeota archaeon]|nr:hypothetical protein [Nanoarchaeota archaeon]
MSRIKQPQFEGFAEVPIVVRKDYNVLFGELGEEVRKVAEGTFNERLEGFPGLAGTLRMVDANGRRELAGSNLPVRAGLNLVDFSGFGIQVCDKGDLARIYNDEVERLSQRKEGFFAGKHWFDLSLIRNPHVTRRELAPWERELNDGINEICGAGEIVSVPYGAIVPVRLDEDNAPFGRISGYSFRISPNAKGALSVVEVTAKEAQGGYDFSRLDENSAFPVKGEGRHFYGIGDRTFSGLYVSRYLSVSCDGDPLGSGEGGRVVFKSRSDAPEK